MATPGLGKGRPFFRPLLHGDQTRPFPIGTSPICELCYGTGNLSIKATHLLSKPGIHVPPTSLSLSLSLSPLLKTVGRLKHAHRKSMNEITPPTNKKRQKTNNPRSGIKPPNNALYT